MEAVNNFDLLKFISNYKIVKYIGERVAERELIPGEINVLIMGSASQSNVLAVSAVIDGLNIDHEGNKVIVADINRGTLQEQAEYVKDENNFSLQTNFEFMAMDLQKMALPDSSIDIIFINNTLNFCENVDCVKESLQEIYRVLKPKGQVFVQSIHNTEKKGAVKYKETYGVLLSEKYFEKIIQKSNLQSEVIEKKMTRLKITPLKKGKTKMRKLIIQGAVLTKGISK
jgi:ubiquinone/menaquinone biosynthesis C-methylase UbiE